MNLSQSETSSLLRGLGGGGGVNRKDPSLSNSFFQNLYVFFEGKSKIKMFEIENTCR